MTELVCHEHQDAFPIYNIRTEFQLKGRNLLVLAKHIMKFQTCLQIVKKRDKQNGQPEAL